VSWGSLAQPALPGSFFLRFAVPSSAARPRGRHEAA
jgi:hypothetical protein